MMLALPAFWVGLLYDRGALDAAWDLVKGWTAADRQALRDAVPARGLAAAIGGRGLQSVAADALKIAEAGLVARGLGEEIFLAPLARVVETGRSPADELIALQDGAWGGDLSRCFTEVVL